MDSEEIKTERSRKVKAKEVKDINDLIEFLGEEKVNQLFMEHYVMLTGDKLIENKDFDPLNQ